MEIYKSNTLLLLYQCSIIDDFLKKSMIYISDFNPLQRNLSINGTREQPSTEMVGYFCNNTRKTTKVLW